MRGAHGGGRRVVNVLMEVGARRGELNVGAMSRHWRARGGRLDFLDLVFALALNLMLPCHRAGLSSACRRLLRLAIANRVDRRLGGRELRTVKGRGASVWW